MNDLDPVLNLQLKRPYSNLQFIRECLERRLANEQGYLASGLQLYGTNDITFKENILVNMCSNVQSLLPNTHKWHLECNVP